jgi:hypothetical protein
VFGVLPLPADLFPEPRMGAQTCVPWGTKQLPDTALLTSSLQNRRVCWSGPLGREAGTVGWADPQSAVKWLLAHLRKGVSLLMLCQKVVGFHLGSSSTKTCCWGRLVGSVGCFWRVR